MVTAVVDNVEEEGWDLYDLNVGELKV